MRPSGVTGVGVIAAEWCREEADATEAAAALEEGAFCRPRRQAENRVALKRFRKLSEWTI